MAELGAAHPRGTFATRQTFAEGFCNLTSLLKTQPQRAIIRLLQVAALAHLAALVALGQLPGNYHLSFVMAAAGAALVLAAYRLRPAPVPALLPASEPIALNPRELHLEIQSQRLVEIADSATRARQDAERRSQNWAALMAQVSHDLRTPLNAVIGFSDVMTAEMFGPMGHPRYREYADHIRDSGRALLKSTEDTLALTQLLAQPGAATGSQGADLPHLACEAWSIHAQAAGARGIRFDLDIEPGTEVLGEGRLIRQILTNLLAEALSRAGDGAVLTLAARGAGELVEIELSATSTTAGRAPGQPSLPLCLARALLELQDAFLVEYPETAGRWRAATMLTRANQQDFFASGRPVALAY